MELNFFDWTTLATCAGATAIVAIITQLIKEVGFIKKIPTQLLSYIIALIVMYPAFYFTGQLNVSSAVLILFNGIVVSLAANGGYELGNKIVTSIKK